MKVSNSVKARAMEKLKEVESPKSASNKPEKWLDTLLTIPFGIYKTEDVFTEYPNFVNKVKLEYPNKK